jgi:hypothetical protein
LEREQKAGALARTIEDEQRRTQDLRAALDRIDRLKVEVEIRDEKIMKMQRQTQIVAASDTLARKRAAAKAPEPVAATEPVVVAGGVSAVEEKLRAELKEARETALARGNEKRAAAREAEKGMRLLEQRLGKRIAELEDDNAAQSRKLTEIRRALGANSALAGARAVVDKILGDAIKETAGKA